MVRFSGGECCIKTLTRHQRFKRTGKRNEIFLATKCGFDLDNDVMKNGPVIKGTPEYVRKALERSLERLGVEQIDLWYCHRYAT